MERLFDTLSKAARLCGNGKENNWSVKVADYFFIDCGCCIFWRGFLVGGVAAAIFFGIGVFLYGVI